MKIAQHFSVGNARSTLISPEGTAEWPYVVRYDERYLWGMNLNRPFGTCVGTMPKPNAEVLGYSHMSLRDSETFDVPQWKAATTGLFRLGGQKVIVLTRSSTRSRTFSGSGA
jgi:hypothetical protein